MKKKLLRLSAASAMALSLSTGVAAANSGSIGYSGPDSTNKVEFRNVERNRVDNNNRVSVKNNNPQSAYTGDARVKHNTTGGDATSGDATNDSLLRATVRLNNSSSSAAALGSSDGGDNSGVLDHTGPGSYNKVSSSNYVSNKVENDNNVWVQNNNSQHASSGDAKVSGNTTGGNATSGNASNISTNETTVEITN